MPRYTNAVNEAIILNTVTAAIPKSATDVPGWDTAVDAVTAAYDTMSDSLTAINNELKAMDLDMTGFRDQMQSAADSLGNLIGIFWIMFLLVLVQGIFGVLNMVAPPKWQPRKACGLCIQPCLTLAFLLIFILIWVCACIFCKLPTARARALNPTPPSCGVIVRPPALV